VIPRNHAPGMDDAEPYLPATDMPRFIRDMMEFVELTERDVVAIRSSAPVVLRHAEALTAALYEKFLALPRSARERMGVRPGQRNLLVRVVLRALTRTLSAAEANVLRDRIYAGLHEGERHEWSAHPA